MCLAKFGRHFERHRTAIQASRRLHPWPSTSRTPNTKPYSPKPEASFHPKSPARQAGQRSTWTSRARMRSSTCRGASTGCRSCEDGELKRTFRARMCGNGDPALKQPSLNHNLNQNVFGKEIPRLAPSGCWVAALAAPCLPWHLAACGCCVNKSGCPGVYRIQGSTAQSDGSRVSPRIKVGAVK